MTTPTPSPLFLQRRSYRQRRMMDALRLLPIMGGLLWSMPLFWPAVSSRAYGPEPVSMSTSIMYVFGVWCLLIVASIALRAALKPTWMQQVTDPDQVGTDEVG